MEQSSLMLRGVIMSKHTPGPWLKHDGSITALYEGYGVGPVCHYNVSGVVETDTANANLIAAAPELLEALEILWGKYHHLANQVESAPKGEKELVRLINDTIAKARGES